MYTEFQEPEIAILLGVPHMVSPVKRKIRISDTFGRSWCPKRVQTSLKQ